MEHALRVLRVLIAKDFRSGIDVETTTAQGWFIDGGLDCDQCLLGLATAGHHGWLVSKNPGTIRMTDAGLTAATRSVH